MISQYLDGESSSRSRANAASHNNQSCPVEEDSAGIPFYPDVVQSTHDSDCESEAQSTHDRDNESEAHHGSQLRASSELHASSKLRASSELCAGSELLSTTATKFTFNVYVSLTLSHCTLRSLLTSFLFLVNIFCMCVQWALVYFIWPGYTCIQKSNLWPR